MGKKWIITEIDHTTDVISVRCPGVAKTDIDKLEEELERIESVWGTSWGSKDPLILPEGQPACDHTYVEVPLFTSIYQKCTKCAQEKE